MSDLLSSESVCSKAMKAIQTTIIVLSVTCGLIICSQIIYKKLQNDPYVFPIFAAQICFILVGILDLFSNFDKTFGNQSQWCKIITPFIFSAISSFFVYLELFCAMIYQNISRQTEGFLYRHIKKICTIFTILLTGVNFFGYNTFVLETCNICGSSKHPSFNAAQVLFYINYFIIPIVPLFPLTYFMIKLYIRYRNLPNSKQLKIFIIPIINFVILLFNNFVTVQWIAKKLSKHVDPIIYMIFYQLLYFTSFVNMFFYRSFIVTFGLVQKQQRNWIKQKICPCLKNNQQQDDLLGSRQNSQTYINNVN